MHGRLAIYNGGAPNFRLWQIGTSHLWGVFTNLEDMQCARGTTACQKQDEENPELPSNIAKAFHVPNPFDTVVYADFQVCPLEHHIPGHMQAACIESATHIVVRR